MKWIHYNFPNGTTRHMRKFLWLPLRINNETRWLESVVLYQRFEHYDIFHGKGNWINISFQ